MASHTPTQSLKQDWVVAGHGAIGLLAACRMKLAGYPVRLLLRSAKPLNIRFSTAEHDHELSFQTTPAHHISAILIPVKTYDVLNCITSLLPALAADAQIVLTHNGMGIAEQVLPLLTTRQGLWFVTTRHGAMKHAQNHIVHTGNGDSVLAPLNQAATIKKAEVVAAMHSAFSPLMLTDNIMPFLWQKLAVNAVINPLTALHDCKNGELQQQHFQLQIKAITHEVCQVATGCGYPLHETTTLQNIATVIQQTAANYSSMRQDIFYCRQTEIDAINGYICDQAARLNIPVPHNQQLLQQIQQRQSQY